MQQKQSECKPFRHTQPLQTQQKPGVTEARHNAEKHFLFHIKPSTLGVQLKHLYKCPEASFHESWKVHVWKSSECTTCVLFPTGQDSRKSNAYLMTHGRLAFKIFMNIEADKSVTKIDELLPIYPLLLQYFCNLM